MTYPKISLHLAESLRREKLIPYYVTKVQLGNFKPLSKSILRKAFLTGVYPGAYTLPSDVYVLIAKQVGMPWMTVRKGTGSRWFPGCWDVRYEGVPSATELELREYWEADLVALQVANDVKALSYRNKDHKWTPGACSIYTKGMRNIEKIREFAAHYADTPEYREKAKAAIELLVSGGELTVVVQ